MQRVKLTIGYDGGHYHGWQKQENHRSLQGTLEAALQKITQNPTLVYGAGRTDAGVHALGQVAHFDTEADFSPAEWQRALNAVLPEDMVIEAAVLTGEDFHARFGAKMKTYRYQLFNAKYRAPLLRHAHWWVRSDLDLGEMRLAAKAFEGRHCFTSFCAADTDAPDHDIYLEPIQITQNGAEIDITLQAQRFLRYMVRNIVGFLVEVGRGKRKANEVAEILSAEDRTKAGPTAPAHGLVLVQIVY